MTVAELFVNIGITGQSTVSKALKGADAGMKELGSSSLATKAAIVGVIFGLERLTSYSSKVGAELFAFGEASGLNTIELQKWQYALGRFGVTADETASTILNLQNIMTDMALGKGNPQALGLLASKVGFDETQRDNPYYLLKKLQEFAKTQNSALTRSVLGDFGLTAAKLVTALKASGLEIDKINAKDIITNPQKLKLNEINKQWYDLWFNLKSLGNHLTMDFGGTAVKELAPKAFAAFGGAAFALVARISPLTAAISALIEVFSQLQKFKKGEDMFFGMLPKEKVKEIKDYWGNMPETESMGPAKNFISDKWSLFKNGASHLFDQAPKTQLMKEQDQKNGVPHTTNEGGNTEVNINAVIEGPNKSPRDIAEEIGRLINRTGFQGSWMADQGLPSKAGR